MAGALVVASALVIPATRLGRSALMPSVHAQAGEIGVPPTDVPATAAPATSAAAPTAAPTSVPLPPTAAAAPTAAPSSGGDRRRDNEEQNPPAAPAQAAATQEIPVGPTRPRRPTRTPRGGVSAVGTPLAAGSLRLVLGADPPVLTVGQDARFRVQLINFSAADASDLTIEVSLPERVIVRETSAALGSVTRSGGLLRWSLPDLEAGGATALEIPAFVATGGAGRISLCASLLSWGAPMEECAEFVTGVVNSGINDLIGASIGRPEASGLAVPASGTPEPTGLLIGMLAGGLTVAFGAWMGLQWRAKKGPL